MKILVSSLVDLKKSQHNRPHQLVKYLSKNNEVTVLSVNDWWKGNQGDLESYSTDFQDFLQNIDYHYLTEREIPPFAQEVFFTKKIKELSKDNFDVHLNYNTMIMGYRVSKSFKTVFDIADDIPAMIRGTPQIPNFISPLGGYMADYYLQKIIRTADHFTFTNFELKEKYQINDDKSTIIPNGVDTAIFKDIKNAKEKLGLDGFIIGYVGVLREWIDLEPVFRALNRLNENIKLLIVGSEGRFMENKLLAKKYGLESRVIFTGMVNHSEIPLYISAMDVCIIPFKLNDISHYALPLKLFEYMACGKPVISTEIMPLKSSFKDEVLFASKYNYVNAVNMLYEDEFLFSKNYNYVNAINMLYEDDALRKKMGNNGIKISKNYDWKNISKKMEKTLEKVAI